MVFFGMPSSVRNLTILSLWSPCNWMTWPISSSSTRVPLQANSCMKLLALVKSWSAFAYLLESLQEFFGIIFCTQTQSDDDSLVKSPQPHLWVIPATWSKSSFHSSAEYEYEGNSAGIQRLGCLREDRPRQQKDLKSALSANLMEKKFVRQAYRKSSGSARSCDVKR